MRMKAVFVPMLLAAAAQAEVDTSEWLCEACPFDEGYRADYEAGAASQSDDAARFGNGNGYDEEGIYPILNGGGHFARDAYQLEWRIEDLGLASRAVDISGGRQGQYGFDVAYSELPYRLFDTTATVFRGSDNRLPAGWVAAGTTGGMTALDASLAKRGIESDRRILDLGGHVIAGKRWRLFADFERQDKEGIDIQAGAGFSQAALLPRNHDYETDRVDAGVQYLLPRGSVTLGYYASFFSNRNDALAWQNPFTTFAGAGQPQMAEPPDNEFQQVSLSGHYRFRPWSSVLAVSLASGSGEQTQAFLPYTSNSGITTGALPRADLGGKVDTSNLAATWTARPHPALRLKAAYRYDERDNATPRSEWTRVIVDLVDSGEPELNTPYSFERSTLSLGAELKLRRQWRLSAGYDYRTLDRDFQEVAEQTEDSGWGQLRWRPTGWADLRVKGGTSRRDIDRYDTAVAQSAGQNPLLRKYNLAYRYREFLEFAASASLPELPVSVGATWYRTDDSYTRSVLGMTDASEDRLTIDLGWTVSERTSLYLMYGEEDIDSSQLGSTAFAAADWSAEHDDRFDHLGLGLVLRDIGGRLDLRLDYSRGKGDTDIAVRTAAGGLNPLPRLDSTLDSLRLEGDYRFSDRLDLTLMIRAEDFSAGDWALRDVDPATIPSVLSLGADPYNYDLWLVGLGFRYHFGERSVSLKN